jgi:hypothetical protein
MKIIDLCLVLLLLPALVPFSRSLVVISPPTHTRYPITTAESLAWATENNVHADHAVTHSLFGEVATYLRSCSSSSNTKYGSRASCVPFVIRRGSSSVPQMITFGTSELQAAIADDYLDAGEGSTDANAGWRMQPVGGNRRGPSFQGARLSFEDVMDGAGTCIFNSAGAYISSTLSASALAALDGLDGAASGVCLNMYVTRGDAKLSAPPHTDKQDVLVVQTQGRKHWRIFSPPSNTNNANGNALDPFTRGKGNDDLPLSLLESSGSKLLLEVTLDPGDILFVPARFPHTTDTLSCYQHEPNKIFCQQDWSIHLTVGLDSHVWSMNYLSMRRLGLRRFSMKDGLNVNVNDDNDDDSSYIGRANSMLREELREALFSSVDSSMLSASASVFDNIDADVDVDMNMEKVAMDLFLLNEQVNNALRGSDEIDFGSLSLAQCILVVTQFRDTGQTVFDTHRKMYTSAIAEEQTRTSRGWSVPDDAFTPMSREQIDRLSIFRVPFYFEQLDVIRDELRTWANNSGSDSDSVGNNGPGAWSASQSILRGDQVEEVNANGIGWSPSSKVIDSRADGLFDLQQFDGTVKKGVRRQDLKGPHGIGIFI